MKSWNEKLMVPRQELQASTLVTNASGAWGVVPIGNTRVVPTAMARHAQKGRNIS